MQACQLALYDNTLTARQRKTTTHAVHFAESTLNTTVYHLMHFRQWLDMLQVRRRIFVEDNAWVHNILWVKEFLYLTHQLVGIISPLATNEWCHIATCSVLCLQTTIVLIYHQIHHGTHHMVVLLNGLRTIKTLVQNKVVVTFQRVTINHGFWIIVLLEQLLQCQGCLCQMLYREGYILNQTRCSYLTSTAYCWENTRAHCPVFTRQYRIRGELCLLAQLIGIQYFL